MFSDKLRFNGSNVDRCRVHRRLHERYVKTSLSLNATHFERVASKLDEPDVHAVARVSHGTHKELG